MAILALLCESLAWRRELHLPPTWMPRSSKITGALPTRKYRTVTVRVAMPWDGDRALWCNSLRQRYQAICKEACSRLAARHLVRDGDVVATVRLLQPSAQGALLPAIIETIRRSDILVFDLAPRPCEKRGNANVLIELGVALALDKPVFVVRSAEPRLPNEPSDLAGLCFHLAGPARFDPSFRAKLRHRIMDIWLKSNVKPKESLKS